jgi:hypothetical protein
MAKEESEREPIERSANASQYAGRSHQSLPRESYYLEIAAISSRSGIQASAIKYKLFCKPYPSLSSLNGSDQQTEMPVSYEKQSTAPFLTGSRIDRLEMSICTHPVRLTNGGGQCNLDGFTV